jgi:DNA-binding NtrC family response regulator
LFYRLNVVPIELPPLRVRAEDIPEFVVQFFHENTERHKRPNLRLPQSLLSRFGEYHWPGNVRELQNAVERMVVLCPGKEITEADMPDVLMRRQVTESAPPNGADSDAETTIDGMERALIIRTLRAVNWNQSEAARRLGISRKMLMLRIEKFGIERDTGAQAT